ncbi:MAG: hypothetical protein PWP65_1703 [Clostridia bacterium]|nr:hypothetical protein [Clostridia bacterium]
MAQGPQLFAPELPVITLADASGAAQAAREGLVVVVVDVIDMATTLEAALEAGAASVYGASPRDISAPVRLDPEAIGLAAGREAAAAGREVVVVAEPRAGTAAEREDRAAPVIRGLAAAGVRPVAVLPNLGAETARLVDFGGKVVVAVSASGGTAFDAAWQAGTRPLTATVARTLQARGTAPALRGVARALSLARQKGCGLAFVAASSHAVEDVLAAWYLKLLANGLKSRAPVL